MDSLVCLRSKVLLTDSLWSYAEAGAVCGVLQEVNVDVGKAEHGEVGLCFITRHTFRRKSLLCTQTGSNLNPSYK